MSNKRSDRRKVAREEENDEDSICSCCMPTKKPAKITAPPPIKLNEDFVAQPVQTPSASNQAKAPDASTESKPVEKNNSNSTQKPAENKADASAKPIEEKATKEGVKQLDEAQLNNNAPNAGIISLHDICISEAGPADRLRANNEVSKEPESVVGLQAKHEDPPVSSAIDAPPEKPQERQNPSDMSPLFSKKRISPAGLTITIDNPNSEAPAAEKQKVREDQKIAGNSATAIKPLAIGDNNALLVPEAKVQLLQQSEEPAKERLSAAGAARLIAQGPDKSMPVIPKENQASPDELDESYNSPIRIDTKNNDILNASKMLHLLQEKNREINVPACSQTFIAQNKGSFVGVGKVERLYTDPNDSPRNASHGNLDDLRAKRKPDSDRDKENRNQARPGEAPEAKAIVNFNETVKLDGKLAFKNPEVEPSAKEIKKEEPITARIEHKLPFEASVLPSPNPSLPPATAEESKKQLGSIGAEALISANNQVLLSESLHSPLGDNNTNSNPAKSGTATGAHNSLAQSIDIEPRNSAPTPASLPPPYPKRAPPLETISQFSASKEASVTNSNDKQGSTQKNPSGETRSIDISRANLNRDNEDAVTCKSMMPSHIMPPSTPTLSEGGKPTGHQLIDLDSRYGLSREPSGVLYSSDIKASTINYETMDYALSKAKEERTQLGEAMKSVMQRCQENEKTIEALRKQIEGTKRKICHYREQIASNKRQNVDLQAMLNNMLLVKLNEYGTNC